MQPPAAIRIPPHHTDNKCKPLGKNKTKNKTTISPHDGETVPKRAETLVDVVSLFLPCARSSGAGAATPLAPCKVNHPQVRVSTLLPHQLDLKNDAHGRMEDGGGGGRVNV